MSVGAASLQSKHTKDKLPAFFPGSLFLFFNSAIIIDKKGNIDKIYRIRDRVKIKKLKILDLSVGT